MPELQERYWYNDFLEFERARGRENRLILGFRYWSQNETRRAKVFLRKNIVVPTTALKLDKGNNGKESIKRKKRIQNIASTWRDNPELHKYPLTVFVDANPDQKAGLESRYPGIIVKPTKGNQVVFQIEMPKEESLLDKLPESFQKGGFDKTFRYDHDWLGRKVSLDSRLEHALTKISELDRKERELDVDLEGIVSDSSKRSRISGRVYKLAYDLSQDFDSEMSKIAEKTPEITRLRDKLVKMRGLVSSLTSDLTLLDKENRVDYNPKERELEIHLNSENGLQFNGPRLTADEIRNQVWFFGDLEKPLWKNDVDKTNLDRREYLLGLLAGKPSKTAININSALKKLQIFLRGTDMEDRQEVERKLAEWRARVKNYSSQKDRINRIVGRLEKKLTRNIGGHEVRLWEDKYDAKISWYTFIIRLPSGEEIRELHTLRDPHLKEVNGYRVVVHETEERLVTAVARKMKEHNVALFCNHNLPYDTTQARFAAEETGADPFDVFVKNILPRRAVVQKVFQRMKKDIDYIDTYRIAAEMHKWLKAKQPYGNHKLETFASYILGPGVFEKSLNYDQMRELEVQAINGDVEAARKLAEYSTSDVGPVQAIIDRTKYIETFVKIREMNPHLSLTEVAFSAKAVEKFFEAKHWREHHNTQYFGYDSKKRLDLETIFKKRLGSVRKSKLKESDVDVSSKPGTHDLVTQVYMPIESWMSHILEKIDPRWVSYFDSMDSEPQARIAQSGYPHAFVKFLLPDHYAIAKDRTLFRNAAASLGIEDHAEDIANRVQREVNHQRFNEMIKSWFNLRNQYRSLHVALSPEGRRIIRVPRHGEKVLNLEFDFGDLFERDNGDLLLLRHNSKRIRRMLSEKQRSVLTKFMSNFKTFYELRDKLAESLNNGEQVSKRNLIYLAGLREAGRRKAWYFERDYGISFQEFDAAWDQGYERLGLELQRLGAQVVEARGDYLFLEGDFTSSNARTFIPIRTIRDYRVSARKVEESNTLELGL